LECSAGIGPVLLLRWYWWRINAWSEISAIVAPFIIYPLLKLYNIQFPYSLWIILGWSTIVWLTITFITKPTKHEKLLEFYNKVKPEGPGWKKFHSSNEKNKIPYFIVLWLLGCVLVISSLFLIGEIILQNYLWALICLFVLLIVSIIMWRLLDKINN
jgi:hypothetical protein